MTPSTHGPQTLVKLDGSRLPERPLTRFAPSVTGHLHLGHVVNAVHVWGLARALSGRVLLRLEDHDRGRYRAEHERTILDDLEWLGLVPDLGRLEEFRAGATEFRQSDRAGSHAAALARLESEARVFACDCSRKQIAERVAQPGEGELAYDGHCRGRGLAHEPGRSVRFLVEGGEEHFSDLLLGQQVQRPARQCGEFVLKEKSGSYSYHFAVTVDDWEQGVDLVIRGEDLLECTGRQLALGRGLGRESPPFYLHHPLLLDSAGKKLSKSEGAPGLAELREQGLSPSEVLGRAAHRGGLQRSPEPVSAAQLGNLVRERIR